MRALLRANIRAGDAVDALERRLGGALTPVETAQLGLLALIACLLGVQVVGPAGVMFLGILGYWLAKNLT